MRTLTPMLILLAGCSWFRTPAPQAVPIAFDSPTSEWPTADWFAGRAGPLTGGAAAASLMVRPMGTLRVPTGALTVVDPFAAMQPSGNGTIPVPPGRYPVTVTVADIDGDGSHLREAYFTVHLADREEVRRRLLVKRYADTSPPEPPEPGGFYGVAVDAGTIAFLDEAELAGMAAPHGWFDTYFDSGASLSWFDAMDSPDNVAPGAALLDLPNAPNGGNIAFVHTGWGDGVYPIIGGYDARDNLVAVHVDFGILWE